MDTRVELAGKLSLAANRRFLGENRELLVSFERTQLQEAMLAWIRLNARHEISEAEPNIETYLRIQERAFLSLLDRSAIKEVAEITPLGWNAVEQMRRNVGQAVPSTPPAPQLTPEQKLEAQVREDWKLLNTKQLRAKMSSDAQYKAMFERIAGTLDSVATEFVAIPGA